MSGIFFLNVPILDIEDKTTTCVFAYKGTPGCVLELQSSTTRCSTNLKSAFELDRFTFDKIGFEWNFVPQKFKYVLLCMERHGLNLSDA